MAQKSVDRLAIEQKTCEAAQARVSEVEGSHSACVAEHDTLKAAQEKGVVEVRRFDIEHREAF